LQQAVFCEMSPANFSDDTEVRTAPCAVEAPAALTGTVWVTGLAAEASKETVKAHFADCGRILRTVLFSGKSAKAKVKFSTMAAQRRAISEKSGSFLNGRKIVVRKFIPSSSRPAGENSSTMSNSMVATLAAPSAVSAAAATAAQQAPVPPKTCEKPKSCAAPLKKFDPEDGLAYSLEEVRAKYAGRLSAPEIDKFFMSHCTDAKPFVESEREERPGIMVDVVGTSQATSKTDAEDGKVYTGEVLRGRARDEGFGDDEITDYRVVESAHLKEGTQERRLDPEDDVVCTFSDIEAKLQGQFTPDEIREYWEFDCAPLLGAASPSDQGSSIKEWLAALDSQWLQLLPEGDRPEFKGVREHTGILEAQFDSLAQILDLYLKVGGGPDGRNVLDDTFFADVGMNKIGQKRLVNKWVGVNT